MHQLGGPVGLGERVRDDVLSGFMDGIGERYHPVLHPLGSFTGLGERPPDFFHHVIGDAAEEQSSAQAIWAVTCWWSVGVGMTAVWLTQPSVVTLIE
jgi:hypothetical protein